MDDLQWSISPDLGYVVQYRDIMTALKVQNLAATVMALRHLPDILTKAKPGHFGRVRSLVTNTPVGNDGGYIGMTRRRYHLDGLNHRRHGRMALVLTPNCRSRGAFHTGRADRTSSGWRW